MARIPFVSLLAVSLLSIFLGAPLAARAQAVTPPPPMAGDDTPPLVKGPEGRSDLPIGRAKGSVGALLFVHGANNVAGAAFTHITATALPGSPGLPGDLRYDRFLGPLTVKSLDQVIRAMAAMYQKSWPQGRNIELTFSDRPAPSELTPAGLADALAIDSMVRNYDIDPSFAAIGAITDEGMVQPVGGMADRLTAAARSRVARIIAPQGNQSQISDYLLSEGITAFVGTQIFTVEDFNQAGVLSLTKLDPKLEEVMRLFTSVQRTLSIKQNEAVALLRSEATQGVLRRVLAAAPNHYSAQVLLDWGTGQKAEISFDGSVDFIDRRAAEVIRALRASPSETLKAPKEKLLENLLVLRFVLERLDTRAKPYASALLRFGDLLQQAVPASGRPSKPAPALQQALDDARKAGNEEWMKMAKERQNSPNKTAPASPFGTLVP